jgi:hypothetical protein
MSKAVNLAVQMSRMMVFWNAGKQGKQQYGKPYNWKAGKMACRMLALIWRHESLHMPTI